MSDWTFSDHLEAALEESDNHEVRRHIREALQMEAVHRGEIDGPTEEEPEVRSDGGEIAVEALSVRQKREAKIAARDVIADAECAALEFVETLQEQIRELSPKEQEKLLREVQQ